MADEEQERFEDYLELERYIADLQAGKVARPPTDMTPEQAQVYQAAALFRSADPEDVEPSAEFAERLKAQLLAIQDEATQANPAERVAVERKNVKPLRFFSRRSLLAGGAVAAAAFVVGAGAERVREQAQAQDKAAVVSSITAHLEISTTIPTTWHFVATLAELGQGAVRFTSDALIGYVVRDSATQEVIALSGACTHMGCILTWQDADRRFHCPCHTATFAETGTHIAANYKYSLPPLPRLHTKIEAGKVYVEVPT